MCCCEDVVVCNEASSAVKLTIIDKTSHPRVFVRSSGPTANDSILLIRNTAVWNNSKIGFVFFVNLLWSLRIIILQVRIWGPRWWPRYRPPTKQPVKYFIRHTDSSLFKDIEQTNEKEVGENLNSEITVYQQLWMFVWGQRIEYWTFIRSTDKVYNESNLRLRMV